ncbi:MAG: S41 family peptidase [Candidatus Eremiobacteraeota bacterium]|nr:S41 family peptidase [Candidatus Eremiobacteraeota bacterium]
MMDFERAAVPYWPIRRRKLLRRNALIVISVLLVAGTALLIRAHEAALPLSQRVFDEVTSTVGVRYYDRGFHGVDWPQLVAVYRPKVIAARDETERYRLLQQMMSKLGDSHTAVFSPTEVAGLSEDASAGALGAAFVRIGNEHVVLRVAPHSPAARAGFRPGLIVSERPALAGAAAYLRSYALRDPVSGRSWQRRVRLTNPTAFDSVTQPELDWGTAAPGIAYLKMASFPNGIEQALNWAIADVGAQPAMIVDLRGNPGGLIDAVDAAAGIFLSPGTLVISGAGRYPLFGRRWFRASDEAHIHYAGKLAVLVDGTSESGAEALASALQTHKRALIVGMPTARKVLGVEVEQRLLDGGLLRVATLGMRDANGQALEGRGVTPDLQVARRATDVAEGRDPQLQAAIAALNAEHAR